MKYQNVKKICLTFLVLFSICALFLPVLGFAAAKDVINLPSWSQNLQGSKRFVVILGGSAVLDKETGLVWERSPSSPPDTWTAAIMNCYGKTVGNKKGWRLPTIEELSTLVDTTMVNPSLPSGHPFVNISWDKYWSITSQPQNNANALYIHFSAGNLGYDSKIAFKNYIWCVRGGHGLDNN